MVGAGAGAATELAGELGPSMVVLVVLESRGLESNWFERLSKNGCGYGEWQLKTWAKGKSNAFENALDPRNIHMGSAATELAMATFEKLSTHFGDIAGWGVCVFLFLCSVTDAIILQGQGPLRWPRSI